MTQAVVSGLIDGAVYALLGVCLVLTFRMTGTLNFAQAGIGAFGAYIAIELHGHGWSYLPAGIVALVAAATLSVLIGVAMNQWFSEASTEVKASVSIAVLIGLLAVGTRIFGPNAAAFPAILPSVHVHVTGVVVAGATLLALALAVLLAGSVALFLGRTHTGHRLRALATRPRTAELHGIPVRRLTVIVWGDSGVISVVAIVLVAPTVPSSYASLTMLIIPVTGAALIGMFRSLGLTLAGGLLIGALTAMASNAHSLAPYHNVVPSLLVILVLLFRERKAVWDAAR